MRFLVVLPIILLGLPGCGKTDADRDITTGATGTDDERNDPMNSVPAVVLQTAMREVPPGGEIYACQDFGNPFGSDVAIVATTSTMTQGAHHMFAFDMGNAELSLFGTMADCPSGGLEFHDYLHTSQLASDRILYPEDVGRLFPAASGVRIMIHMLNTSTEAIVANVEFKMNYLEPSAVAGKAAPIFLNNVGLTVPMGKSTQTATYTVPRDVALLRGISHMHRHGSHFRATLNDGTMLYESSVWEEPAPRAFDPALPLAKGTQITWSCDYENDTGGALRFGESAAKNEMCIFSGMFYDGVGTQMASQFPFF
jgi:hypothetical protein